MAAIANNVVDRPHSSSDARGAGPSLRPVRRSKGKDKAQPRNTGPCGSPLTTAGTLVGVHGLSDGLATPEVSTLLFKYANSYIMRTYERITDNGNSDPQIGRAALRRTPSGQQNILGERVALTMNYFSSRNYCSAPLVTNQETAGHFSCALSSLFAATLATASAHCMACPMAQLHPLSRPLLKYADSYFNATNEQTAGKY